MSRWPLPPSVQEIPRPVGRIIVCTRCHATVDVLEAAQGARTDREHRWLNPAVYRCADCTFATETIDLLEGDT